MFRVVYYPIKSREVPIYSSTATFSTLVKKPLSVTVDRLHMSVVRRCLTNWLEKSRQYELIEMNFEGRYVVLCVRFVLCRRLIEGNISSMTMCETSDLQTTW